MCTIDAWVRRYGKRRETKCKIVVQVDRCQNY